MSDRATTLDVDVQDWLTDHQVRDLADASKAIWFDVLCVLRLTAHQDGVLAKTLCQWARNLGRGEAAVLAAFRELQAIGTADVAPNLEGDVPSEVVITIACRRMRREAERRRTKRDEKARNRSRNRLGESDDRAADDRASPSCRQLVATVSPAGRHDVGAKDPCPSSPPSSSPLLPPHPPELTSFAPTAPSSAADAAASPPDPGRSSWPEIPETLRPFERWHSRAAVKAPHVAAQRAFVEGWEQRLAVAVRTFPGLDVLGEIREAYAWEEVRPMERKTPQGRWRFLLGWLGREQDKARRVVGPATSGVASGGAATIASLASRAPPGAKVIKPHERPTCSSGAFGVAVGQHGGFLAVAGDALTLHSFAEAFGAAARIVWSGTVTGVRAELERPRCGSPQAVAAALRAGITAASTASQAEPETTTPGHVHAGA